MDDAWDLFGFISFLAGLSLFVVIPIWVASTLDTTRRMKLVYGIGGAVVSVLWLVGIVWLALR